MDKIRLGDVVLYRPDKTHGWFHDKGCEPQLPAMITKIWGDTVDLFVFLNGAFQPVHVPHVAQGDAVGKWQPR